MIYRRWCNNRVISYCPVKSLSNWFSIYRKTVRMAEAESAEWLTVPQVQLEKLFPVGCFAHWILKASGKVFRSDDSMVPADNKMILYFFLCVTNICLVLEAWLAAAFSIWSSLELMFQWDKVSKAVHWSLLYIEKLRSKGNAQCLPLTFALTKKRCSILRARKTIIMLLWCSTILLYGVSLYVVFMLGIRTGEWRLEGGPHFLWIP